MSHTEAHRQQEEEEKIIICGAVINRESAKSIAGAAASILEMDNLFRQTVKHPPRRALDYYNEVKRRAERIAKLAGEIEYLATSYGENNGG